MECKACNSNTIQKKKVAWQKITEAFNSSIPQNSPLDSKTPLGLWQRLKLHAKSSLDDKRKKSKTGGGPPPSPLSPLVENMLVVLGNSGEPLGNPYNNEIPAKGVVIQLLVLSEREVEGGYRPDTEVKEVEKEDVIKSTGERPSPQTPYVNSRKRRHKEDEEDEAVRIMQEIHKKQLRVFELQEKKVLLDIYLMEQEIIIKEKL
ncbi:uncharacterized protein [Anabrus simplex]|uniref:uncharacterized protein n=1 Tax=Anabrus simplex TaxID=316456 RepID=UPI0035A2E634